MSKCSHKTEQVVIYRIYTEEKHDVRLELEKLISEYFDGFSINSGVGFWKGRRELSTIIELIGDYPDKSKVLKLAAEIKILGNQESVLVTTVTGFVNEIN